MTFGPSSLFLSRRAARLIALACIAIHAVPVVEASRHQTVHAIEGSMGDALEQAAASEPFVSAVVEPDQPFTEALLSINAGVPKSAVASAYLRVRDVDGAWSPWLFVMDWAGEDATLSGGAKITESSLGRIDVDYFKSDQPMAAAQVRIAADGGVVTVSDVSLTFTSARGSDATTDREVDAVELAVPFRSQRAEDPSIAGRICSPTSVAMVLEYHGITVPTQQAADTIYDPRHDIFGNWPRAVQGAHAMGGSGHLTRFDDWHAVRETLSAGSPIIASIRVRAGQLDAAPYDSTAGHLIVISGLDGAGNAIVNDCAATTSEAGKRLLYPMEDMETVWFQGSNGTAYVLTPVRPGREP